MKLRIPALVVLLLIVSAIKTMAQTLPISFNFQSTTLPAGLTTNGTVSTSGGIGTCTVCSPGRLEIPVSGFLQIDVPSVSALNLNMKSSGASARVVTIKYKLAADPTYATAGTISVPQVGGTFELVTLFPVLASPVPVSIRLENGTGGMFHIHDILVQGAAVSADAEITAFVLSNQQIGSAVINSAVGTINVTLPNTAVLTNLVPQTLTLSPGSTVSPLATASQDFSVPVVYTVTAQNTTTTKAWTVSVTLTAPSGLTDYQAEEAEFTGTIDNNNAGFTGAGFINFLASGENTIIFNVCQTAAGTQTAKFRYALGVVDTRTGKLYVNDVYIQDLSFAPTGAWTTWADETVSVTLLAGMNNIKITWIDTDGPNLDKLSLSGTQCIKYLLTVNTTNAGTVSVSPKRSGNQYFNIETVTLLAETTPSLTFNNWSGDITGTTNPVQLPMTGNKTVTANFTPVPTFTLQVATTGTGQVVLSPAGGVYASGTTVTLTANTVLGSTFQGWGGDASGAATTTTVVMNANRSVTAAFSGNTTINFATPIGFASVNTGSTYPNFNGSVTGGQNATDTFWVNGAADFDALAWRLYYRNRAYNIGTPQNGVPKAPLVIAFRPGIYPEGTSTSTAWGNHMMTVQEQGDLTIIGQGNVVLKFGLNIKRSWNILIRNISIQDYYDDGINIGEPETHHIWVDHCTLGHPVALPADSEHPDGSVDTKAGASYVTISWCIFRNSWKTSLIGHSDNNGAEDIGKLKVTYYANHFLGTNSRNPRVRFGEVHVLNNLCERIGLYGIASAKDGKIVAEGNFYLNTRWPMYADRATADFRTVYGNNTDNVFTSKTGNLPCTYLKQFNNDYDDSGLPVITSQINPAMLNPGGRSIKFDELNAAAAFDPHSYYTYTAFTPAVVRTLIPIFAGANVVDFFIPAVVPASIATTGTLTNFSQTVGAPSAVQTYAVSGANLTGNITITPPTDYEVSSDGGTTWRSNASPLVLTQSGGTVASTTISVRLNATVTGPHSGNIAHTSTGVTTVNVAVNGTTVPPPAITATATLNSFSHVTGVPSAIQTYTVSGANLTGNITITPPANYEVSSDGGTTWRTNASPLVLTQSGGTIANTTISVRLNASAAGSYTGNIAHTSAAATTVNIPVTGTTIPAPVITATGTLNNFSQTIGGASATQTYTIAGANLTANISITAPAGYEISSNGGTSWNTTLTLTQTGGTVASTTISVRLNATTVGASSGNIVHTSTGAPVVNKAVTGTTVPAPLITTNASLSLFNQVMMAQSPAQTYTVAGTNLAGNITITPPYGYELSLDGITWSIAAITLSRNNGAIPATTIYVRLNSTFIGTHNGIITNASTGTATVNVAVNGITHPSTEFMIYPVPAFKTIFITHPVTSERAPLAIYNSTGQKVAEYMTEPNTVETRIDITKWQCGIYTVQYRSGNDKLIMRFAKF
jgi:pectate lyase